MCKSVRTVYRQVVTSSIANNQSRHLCETASAPFLVRKSVYKGVKPCTACIYHLPFHKVIMIPGETLSNKTFGHMADYLPDKSTKITPYLPIDGFCTKYRIVDHRQTIRYPLAYVRRMDPTHCGIEAQDFTPFVV